MNLHEQAQRVVNQLLESSWLNDAQLTHLKDRVSVTLDRVSDDAATGRPYEETLEKHHRDLMDEVETFCRELVDARQDTVPLSLLSDRAFDEIAVKLIRDAYQAAMPP